MSLKPKLTYLLLTLCVAGLVATGCSKESKKAGHLKRAEAFFTQGDYDRAELEYKNVMRFEPTNRAAIRNLGLMSYDQGRTAQAIFLLALARTNDPGDLEVRLRIATLQLAGGAATNARSESLQMLGLQPTNEQALVLLAESSLTTNDVRDAQQRLANLKPAAGNTAGFHLASGVLLLRRGDFTNGEAAFRQALAIDPKSSSAYAAIGNLCLLRNDRTNAGAAFRAAAENAPPRSAHRLRYAEFQLALGDVAAAKQQLEAVSKQAPDYLPCLMKLAQIALAERRFPDCEGVLRSVQTRDQTHLDAMLLMARLRVAQNEPAKAVLELDRALKVYALVPQALPQVHYQLAIVRIMQNDLPGALKSLNDTLALAPGSPEATLLLAELNIRRKNEAAAIDSLTKLVARYPNLVQAQLILANAYRGTRQFDRALKIYENLSRSYPTNPQPAFLMGLVLGQQGKTAAARKCFADILQTQPNFTSAVEQLVNLDLSEKQFPAALERAQREADRQPTNALPYLLVAKVQMASTNLAAAETALLKAAALAPESGVANSLLAQVYVARNKHQDAIQKLNEVVTRNTNDLMAWLQIAELHSAASNYSASRDAYEKLLAAEPRFGPALNNLAYLYSERLGDVKRAYELGSRARDLMPTNAPTADTFGWILYRNRDYPRALSLIQEAERALPLEPEVQFHLGMTHYMMGEESAALVALSSAVQLGAPDAAWRSEAQQRLQVLQVDPLTADPGAARDLEKLLPATPDDPLLLIKLAAFAERAGDWPKAIKGYESALKANDNLVPAMVKLAKIYSGQSKDPARALALARRARGLESSDPIITHELGRLALDAAQSATDFEWAFGLLRESVQNLPNDVQVRFDYAQACFKLGQPAEAAAATQVALQAGLPPASKPQAESFARMLALARDADLAVANAAEVEALLKRQPDSLPALVVQGVIQERKGNYSAARDSYESVLKLSPVFAPANKALAALYLTQLKDPQKAYDYAVKSREAFPRDSSVARTLGLLTYQRSDFSRAAGLLTECLATYPEDPEVRYCLGLSQYKLKQTSESKANLTKALALAPNSNLAPEAKRLLAELK